MTADGTSPTTAALRRILARAGSDDLVDVLVDRLSGADLTTLLLEVMRRRATQVTPADLLRQYGQDRFTEPAYLDGRRLHSLIGAVLTALPDDVDLVELAPVSPLGTHSVVATVHQHKVMATARGREVAADPTNALALEAAIRRRALLRDDPRSAGLVRLAAVQRVLRGQRFGGAGVQQHFSLLGIVTAGRDQGSHRFESAALAADVGVLVDAVLAAGVPRAEVRVTDLSGGRFDALGALTDAFAGRAQVLVIADPERATGRGYYTDVCFKIHAGGTDGQLIEVADGGVVDWTQRLLSNHKERLLIGGLGIEMLARQAPAG